MSYPQQGAGLNNYIMSLTSVYLCLPQLMNTLALFTIFIISKVSIRICTTTYIPLPSSGVVECVAPTQISPAEMGGSDRPHQVQSVL